MTDDTPGTADTPDGPDTAEGQAAPETWDPDASDRAATPRAESTDPGEDTDGAANGRLLVALIVVGTLAATLVPGAPVGVGAFLTALAVAVAVAWLRRGPKEGWTVWWTLVAVALAVTVVWSDAAWVVAPAVAASVIAGAFAVTGARRWTTLLAAPFGVLRALLPAVRTSTRTARDVRPDARERVAPVLRGTALAAMLFVVFGTLFASADRAFAELAGEYLVPDVNIGLVPARIAAFAAAAMATGAFALARTPAGVPGGTPGGAPTPAATPIGSADGRLGRTEWLIALTGLDLLFTAFVAVQITVLFGGRAHVLSTTDLTYAEYAREGFFQLLAVSVLTIVVVAASAVLAERRTARDRRVLQALLGGLVVLTFVVLASAMRRLGLYEAAFGYTRTRLAAHAAILTIAVVLALLLAAGVRWNAAWLPRTLASVGLVAVVAFAFARPDALIADRNIARFEATGEIDVDYLDGLSADAVPALSRLPEELRACVLADDADRLSMSRPWNGANLARARAGAALDRLPELPAFQTCTRPT